MNDESLKEVLRQVRAVFDCVKKCPNCDACKKLIETAEQCLSAVID